MSDTPVTDATRRQRGQLLFAIGFFVIAVALLSQIGEQTRWVSKTQLFAQPAFWPALSLAGMVLFGALHWWRLPRRTIRAADWQESLYWLRPIEFALWFMVYVALVPLIGFLPCSVLFSTLLCRRMGYRDWRMLVIAALFGALVVIIFKSLLSVRIPAAMWYDALPGSVRSFFILNF